jgi:hypothetical protein
MKRNILMIIYLAFITSNIYSQIGIKIQSPETGSVLHIDTKGNTSGATNFSDDILINSQGQIGIGTLTPDAKVDIRGNIKITNGSEGKDRALVSDAIGRGTWETLSLGANSSEWRVTGTPARINAGFNSISGTATFINNSLGLTTNGTSSVTLPAGKYLLFLRGDINVREYGRMMIYNSVNVLFSVLYSEALSGATCYAEFTSPVSLTVKFDAIDVRSNAASAIPFITPLPYQVPNLTIWASIVILQLKD